MNDELFSTTTRIARPAKEVFAWHERPGAFARLCPPWERVEIVSATGGIRDGARVVVRNKVGPFWCEWEVEHRDYAAGAQFRDVQVRGPFAKWEHLHRVEPDGADACWLTDEITYRLPGGTIGRVCGGDFVRRKLARLFAWRHATTKADVELAASHGNVNPQRVLLAGASGLIGRALAPFLQTQGHRVVRLVRRKPTGEDEFFWNPACGEIDAAALEGVDAIINLAGENVGGGRWTAARREAILHSRLCATKTLIDSVRKLRRRPAVFVNASALGFYGDRGDERLTETSGNGRGFLADVCVAWEAEAREAAGLGMRTVVARFGVVLTPAGGALGKLLPLFRAGLGGRMASGRQWMSWIGIDDAVGAIYHAMIEPRCTGAMNIVAPGTVTNAEFTAALARVLGRGAPWRVPARILRWALGQMADETILGSARAVPERLEETRFRFRHAKLSDALRAVLGHFNE